MGRLDERYEENVLPYETIIKTISLHNGEIYALQQQYCKLQKQYNTLKAEVQIKQSSIELNKQRQRELKKERNRFLEEALSAREKEFDEQYQSKRMQRLE